MLAGVGCAGSAVFVHRSRADAKRGGELLVHLDPESGGARGAQREHAPEVARQPHALGQAALDLDAPRGGGAQQVRAEEEGEQTVEPPDEPAQDVEAEPSHREEHGQAEQAEKARGRDQRGTSTESRMRSSTSSGRTPSISSAGSSAIRWRKVGMKTSLMSSGVT